MFAMVLTTITTIWRPGFRGYRNTRKSSYDFISPQGKIKLFLSVKQGLIIAMKNYSCELFNLTETVGKVELISTFTTAICESWNVTNTLGIMLEILKNYPWTRLLVRINAWDSYPVYKMAFYFQAHYMRTIKARFGNSVLHERRQ